MLRTKTYFSQYTNEQDQTHEWSSGDSTTAVYWCLSTMGSVGPDDGFAHPHDCCANRACFKGEIE
jgi:hypothetical protein